MIKSTLEKTSIQLYHTPRPYLSWSQLNLFERNPHEYVFKYIYGDDSTNPRMQLGKQVAEMIESGEEQMDKELEFYRIFLPKFPLKEHPIEAKFGNVPIKGVLDGFNQDALWIGEYKTGSKWNQKMVNESGQLSFYALLVYLKHGRLPNRITLHWMPTILNETGLHLTNDIKTFETSRSEMDIVKMGARIAKAWAGIRKICKEEYQSLGLL